jgi:carboxymethylenebutenolidase
MTIIADSFVDIATSRGPMRLHLFIPQGKGRHPGVIFYSEIFQVTGPIRRMASALSGHGYLVAVPEVYHEFEPPGTVLAYDQAGSDRGNELKYTKEVASYDEDTEAAVKLLLGHESCTGRIGSYGVCLGGHLAVRAGFHPDVSAVVAFYPTDIHSSSLGAGRKDDTLQRLGGTKTPILFVGEDRIPMSRSRAGSKLPSGSMKQKPNSNGMSSTPPTRFCATKVRAMIRRSRMFA